jgi:hypothetical protein
MVEFLRLSRQHTETRRFPRFRSFGGSAFDVFDDVFEFSGSPSVSDAGKAREKRFFRRRVVSAREREKTNVR